MVFGDLGFDRDHRLSPILKLIDFSGARLDEEEVPRLIGDSRGQPESVKSNIWGIGMAMCSLILSLEEDVSVKMYEGRERTVPIVVTPNITIQSVAVELYYHDDGTRANTTTDSALLNLVARCMATNRAEAINLLDLHNAVEGCAAERDYNWYVRENTRLGGATYNVDIERDDYIDSFVRRHILNAVP
ncbi:hypothetical protein GGR57DRAFT_321182 [Xylariaceae sp. FL1272]|nr:hypothetical protein GGR57DRAFT_321182 [Xylariaceae sp. FL1272]